MDLRISRRHQARLDLVEGLKVHVAGQLMPSLRQEFENWCATEKPSEGQLRDSQFMQANLGSDPLYQTSRGLQRLSQEAMWQEVIYGLEEQKPKIEGQLNAQEESKGSLTLDPDLRMPDYYDEEDESESDEEEGSSENSEESS